MSGFVVCALYKFTRLGNYRQLQAPLLRLMHEHQVRGTLLLAEEGINGTVAASREGIDALLAWLHNAPGLEDIDAKESGTDVCPFKRTRVKLKKEIVTMGVPGIDPQRKAGTYISPREWNRLISDPEVLLVDTRNDYEVEVGTFRNAINPETGSFREFPRFVKENLDPQKHKKVAMFCTGGIRCEKSTAFLKEQGFDEVYHLKGGILKYLEEVPASESLWDGECFVFDDRVTVNQRLQKGGYDQCNACRRPLGEADKTSDLYEHGVSCPRCHSQSSIAQKARYRERQKQVELARQRGEVHLGDDANTVAADRRELKISKKNSCKSAQG